MKTQKNEQLTQVTAVKLEFEPGAQKALPLARAAFSMALHHHKPEEQGPLDTNLGSVKERTPRLTVPAASVQAADMLPLCLHKRRRRLQRERQASSEPGEPSGAALSPRPAAGWAAEAARGCLLPSAGDQEEQAGGGPRVISG